MIKILQNLKKIEKALDLRFQTDSTLYISKEDSNHICKYLHEGDSKKILQIAKILKNGHEVVAKVVLENSYLIKNSKLFKDLKELFLKVDSHSLQEFTKNIRDDLVYSSLEFKNFIETINANSLNTKTECRNLYQNQSENLDRRIGALARYLELDNDSKINKLKNLHRNLNDYAELKNSAALFKDIEIVFKESNKDEQKELADYILKNNLLAKNNPIVYKRLFKSFSNVAFLELISFLSNKDKTSKEYFFQDDDMKYLARKTLQDFKNLDIFEENIKNLFSYSKKSLKNLLCEMIENIYNDGKNGREIALTKSLANYFLISSSDLSDKKKNILEDIKNGRSGKNEDLLDSIKKNQNLFSNSPYGSLGYFERQLKDDKDIQLLIDNLSDYQNCKKIKLILSYKIAQKLKFNQHLAENLKGLLEDDSMVYLVSSHLEILDINTKKSREFLEKYKQYELLQKFNRR